MTIAQELMVVLTIFCFVLGRDNSPRVDGGARAIFCFVLGRDSSPRVDGGARAIFCFVLGRDNSPRVDGRACAGVCNSSRLRNLCDATATVAADAAAAAEDDDDDNEEEDDNDDDDDNDDGYDMTATKAMSTILVMMIYIQKSVSATKRLWLPCMRLGL